MIVLPHGPADNSCQLQIPPFSPLQRVTRKSLTFKHTQCRNFSINVRDNIAVNRLMITLINVMHNNKAVCFVRARNFNDLLRR